MDRSFLIKQEEVCRCLQGAGVSVRSWTNLKHDRSYCSLLFDEDSSKYELLEELEHMEGFTDRSGAGA